MLIKDLSENVANITYDGEPRLSIELEIEQPSGGIPDDVMGEVAR